MRGHSPGEDALGNLRALWPSPHQLRFHTWPRPYGSELSYSLLPRPSRATLLLPTAPRAVAAATLRNYKSPTTRRAHARARVSEQAARLGMARMLPGRITISQPQGGSSLVKHLGLLLDEDLVAGIHLGPPRANRKPVLQLFDQRGRSIAFAKVALTELTRRRVRHEAAALGALRQVELQALSVPRVLAHGVWGDCEYLLLSSVTTWAPGGVRGDLRVKAMREMAVAFGTASAELAALPWWISLVGRLRKVQEEPEAAALLGLADRIGALAGSRQVRVGSAHGDWTPWNMATPHEGAVAWDWERFSRRTPLGSDALHYSFQSAVRLGRNSPRSAVRLISSHAADLVTESGADPTEGPLLLALYLLQLGEQYICDGQSEAGARKGPLASWLIPELSAVVDVLGDT